MEDVLIMMTTIVAAKEQEIEALMQALDEEENQMESLRNKVEELESTLQHMNSDMEHVEDYCAKAVKKFLGWKRKVTSLKVNRALSKIQVHGLVSTVRTRFTPSPDHVEFLLQGVHPCDKRSTRSEYQSSFPAVDFSLIESDEDILWNETVRESNKELTERLMKFMKWRRKSL